MKNNNLYNELSIIISQQNILSQKVGILLAINSLFIGFIISISLNYSFWILFLLIFPSSSFSINVYILFPNFKSSNNSKYFYDYHKMEISEIEKSINDDQNTLHQLMVNSKILNKKYKLYSHSLAINCLFIPYLFLLLNNKSK